MCFPILQYSSDTVRWHHQNVASSNPLWIQRDVKLRASQPCRPSSMLAKVSQLSSISFASTNFQVGCQKNCHLGLPCLSPKTSLSQHKMIKLLRPLFSRWRVLLKPSRHSKSKLTNMIAKSKETQSLHNLQLRESPRRHINNDAPRRRSIIFNSLSF